MPRVKRRLKLRRLDVELDEKIRHGLHTGHFYNEQPTEEEHRQLWEQFREVVTADWVEKWPGTRPAAWWTFDAPERRRRIDGKPHPYDRPDHPLPKLWYGVPAVISSEDEYKATYETEADYLARHRLLSAAERKAMKTADYSNKPPQLKIAK